MAELTGYLAPEGFLNELLTELGSEARETHGRLVLAEREMPVAWAANVWRAPMRIDITSIGDAAKKLRAIQRNWALYSSAQHRRAALIADKLPKVSAKPMVFGTPAPVARLGSWTLLDKDTLLAASHCASAFPNGEVRFIEDRNAPPSRAYLKLWELFTRLGVQPRPGETCIDLGASPGGWTWVLAQLGVRVISVDKAPLEPSITNLPGVAFQRGSAFAVDPRAHGHVDWLFSDVVCYPKRLLALVGQWLAAGTVRRLVCTIKFQGPTDFDSMREFAAISGSQLLHLHHNKHELTWVKL